MYTASLRGPRPVAVLGTVMGVDRDGQWFLHRVAATGPDGRRIHLEVASRSRHTGSVTVRWDPEGIAEARFIEPRRWGRWVALLALAAIVAAVIWFFF